MNHPPTPAVIEAISQSAGLKNIPMDEIGQSFIKDALFWAKRQLTPKTQPLSLMPYFDLELIINFVTNPIVWQWMITNEIPKNTSNDTQDPENQFTIQLLNLVNMTMTLAKNDPKKASTKYIGGLLNIIAILRTQQSTSIEEQNQLMIQIAEKIGVLVFHILKNLNHQYLNHHRANDPKTDQFSINTLIEKLQLNCNKYLIKNHKKQITAISMEKDVESDAPHKKVVIDLMFSTPIAEKQKILDRNLSNAIKKHINQYYEQKNKKYPVSCTSAKYILDKNGTSNCIRICLEQTHVMALKRHVIPEATVEKVTVVIPPAVPNQKRNQTPTNTQAVKIIPQPVPTTKTPHITLIQPQHIATVQPTPSTSKTNHTNNIQPKSVLLPEQNHKVAKQPQETSKDGPLTITTSNTTKPPMLLPTNANASTHKNTNNNTVVTINNNVVQHHVIPVASVTTPVIKTGENSKHVLENTEKEKVNHSTKISAAIRCPQLLVNIPVATEDQMKQGAAPDRKNRYNRDHASPSAIQKNTRKEPAKKVPHTQMTQTAPIITAVQTTTKPILAPVPAVARNKLVVNQRSFTTQKKAEQHKNISSYNNTNAPTTSRFSNFANGAFNAVTISINAAKSVISGGAAVATKSVISGGAAVATVGAKASKQLLETANQVIGPIVRETIENTRVLIDNATTPSTSSSSSRSTSLSSVYSGEMEEKNHGDNHYHHVPDAHRRTTSSSSSEEFYDAENNENYNDNHRKNSTVEIDPSLTTLQSHTITHNEDTMMLTLTSAQKNLIKRVVQIYKRDIKDESNSDILANLGNHFTKIDKTEQAGTPKNFKYYTNEFVDHFIRNLIVIEALNENKIPTLIEVFNQTFSENLSSTEITHLPHSREYCSMVRDLIRIMLDSKKIIELEKQGSIDYDNIAIRKELVETILHKLGYSCSRRHNTIDKIYFIALNRAKETTKNTATSPKMPSSSPVTQNTSRITKDLAHSDDNILTFPLHDYKNDDNTNSTRNRSKRAWSSIFKTLARVLLVGMGAAIAALATTQVIPFILVGFSVLPIVLAGADKIKAIIKQCFKGRRTKNVPNKTIFSRYNQNVEIETRVVHPLNNNNMTKSSTKGKKVSFPFKNPLSIFSQRGNTPSNDMQKTNCRNR